MKLRIVSLLMVVAMIAIGTVANAQAATGTPLAFTASYDFSASAPCAGVLVSDCVSGFRWGFKVGTNDLSLGTIPLPATLTGVVTLSPTTNVGPPYGNISFYIVAQAKASDGSIVESLPLATSVLVRPNPFKTFTSK